MKPLPFAINYDLVALLNFVFNMGIFAICVCRCGRMEGVLVRVKVQYVLLMVASLACGLAPVFFQQWPTIAFTSFAGVVLLMIWTDSYQWKNGPPKAAMSDVAPLIEEK